MSVGDGATLYRAPSASAGCIDRSLALAARIWDRRAWSFFTDRCVAVGPTFQSVQRQAGKSFSRGSDVRSTSAHGAVQRRRHGMVCFPPMTFKRHPKSRVRLPLSIDAEKHATAIMIGLRSESQRNALSSIGLGSPILKVYEKSSLASAAKIAN